MPNVEKIISAHNKRVLKKKKTVFAVARLYFKERCPLVNSKTSCRTDNVIYQAEVKSENTTKTYIQITSLEFKQRVSKHGTDFKHRKYKESTKLSKHIWDIKDKNEKYEIRWSILKRVKRTENGDKTCRLCKRSQFHSKE